MAGRRSSRIHEGRSQLYPSREGGAIEFYLPVLRRYVCISKIYSVAACKSGNTSSAAAAVALNNAFCFKHTPLVRAEIPPLYLTFDVRLVLQLSTITTLLSSPTEVYLFSAVGGSKIEGLFEFLRDAEGFRRKKLYLHSNQRGY